MKIVMSLLVAIMATQTNSCLAARFYFTPEEQCTSVDFRQTFPLKMRNQGETSWCYANAASDYLQYTYHLNEQVSAADIAINYSQTIFSKIVKIFDDLIDPSERGKPPETGLIAIAVKRIIPQGYCPESALPSDFWNRVSAIDGSQTKEEILQSILDTYDLQQKIYTGSITSAAQMPSYFTFKNINRDQFYEILKNSTHKQVLLELREAACKNERKPFGDTSIGSDFMIRGRHAFQHMSASFDRGMPVTVDFADDVFFHYDNPSKKIAGLHTVIVYGRKFDSQSQECQYMLKDSHGAQCTRYDPKIPCENGYLWLPESKLFRAMTSELILYR